MPRIPDLSLGQSLYLSDSRLMNAACADVAKNGPIREYIWPKQVSETANSAQTAASSASKPSCASA